MGGEWSSATLVCAWSIPILFTCPVFSLANGRGWSACRLDTYDKSEEFSFPWLLPVRSTPFWCRHNRNTQTYPGPPPPFLSFFPSFSALCTPLFSRGRHGAHRVGGLRGLGGVILQGLCGRAAAGSSSSQLRRGRVNSTTTTFAVWWDPYGGRPVSYGLSGRGSCGPLEATHLVRPGIHPTREASWVAPGVNRLATIVRARGSCTSELLKQGSGRGGLQLASPAPLRVVTRGWAGGVMLVGSPVGLGGDGRGAELYTRRVSLVLGPVCGPACLRVLRGGWGARRAKLIV